MSSLFHSSGTVVSFPRSRAPRVDGYGFERPLYCYGLYRMVAEAWRGAGRALVSKRATPNDADTLDYYDHTVVALTNISRLLQDLAPEDEVRRAALTARNFALETEEYSMAAWVAQGNLR